MGINLCSLEQEIISNFIIILSHHVVHVAAFCGEGRSVPVVMPTGDVVTTTRVPGSQLSVISCPYCPKGYFL